MGHEIDWKLLWRIFVSFLKISPVTFGGGYAMLPVIEHEVVEKRKWMDAEEMSNVISISGSTPGGIGVNAAVFIGYRLAWIPGAVVATIGITLPTFLIVLILILSFQQVSDNPKIAAALEGIRMSIVALIAYAGFRIGKSALFDKTTLAVGLVTIFLLFLSFVHPVLLIPIGGLVGIGAVKLKEKAGIPTVFEQSDQVKLKKTSADMKKSADNIVYKHQDYFFGDGI